MNGPERERTDPRDEVDDDLLRLCSGRMTLEIIVDTTGEFEHLDELVRMKIDKSGGFKGAEDYFLMVTPILDLLEVEIRVRYTPGMTRSAMKSVIRTWIDKEMEEIR
jgi:hypothetical protein